LPAAGNQANQLRTRIPMKRFALPALVLLLLALAAGAWWWWSEAHHPVRDQVTLYGNIDLRQVDLPFNGSERVAQVLAQEGDSVKGGQVLARLDTSRLAPQVAKAEAGVAAQQQVVSRLRNGNRPEEIDEARANVAVAQAESINARSQYERLRTLSENSAGRALSRQDLDSAKAGVDAAEARLTASQKALVLELAGPRKEDVAQAQAQLRAEQADLALLRQQWKDADLLAPLDAVVRSRIIEPGEIASPQKTAFTLAIADPKWVRAYVSETDLGSLHEGLKAIVTADAFAGRNFPGWVGFISPVAEFTPKSVETSELRSSLVYQVRIFVQDPANELRLGMPATVRLSLTAEKGAANAAQPSGR
jgi:HlyD family secretion protein